MPLGGAISPKKSHARTHTHTPPVGLSPPIQHIITVAKLRTGIHSLRGWEVPMKNSFLIRDGDSLEFIIFDDGIIFSLLLLSLFLAAAAAARKSLRCTERRREERRGEERTTPTRLGCSIFLILLCREVLRSFSSTGELCLFTVFHILASLASWWWMSPKQSGSALFAVCLFYEFPGVLLSFMTDPEP